jgi:PhzF family phenazine biosynthesis protein
VSRALPVLRVDVFASRPFAGNPAAAVLDADGVPDAALQAIAGELRAAGTAFLSRAERPEAGWRLRMFTPTREIAYSGHTALGGARALMDAGRLDASRAVFETGRGLLPVAIDGRGDDAVLWLEPPLPECRPYAEPLAPIAEALGLGDTGPAGWAPPAVTPERDLLLPARDVAALHALRPDLARLAGVAAERGLRGCCVVAPGGVEAGSAVHSRFFAPHYGIPEDIVTGSVHSALAVWLLDGGRLAAVDGRAAFTAEQGDVLGRPGRLAVELRLSDGRPAAVRVGGRALTVLTGHLRLP